MKINNQQSVLLFITVGLVVSLLSCGNDSDNPASAKGGGDLFSESWLPFAEGAIYTYKNADDSSQLSMAVNDTVTTDGIHYCSFTNSPWLLSNSGWYSGNTYISLKDEQKVYNKADDLLFRFDVVSGSDWVLFSSTTDAVYRIDKETMYYKGMETVTVPAGTFECRVFQYDKNRIGRSGHGSVYVDKKYYLAKGVGLVRYEHDYRSSVYDRPVRSYNPDIYELTSYSLGE